MTASPWCRILACLAIGILPATGQEEDASERILELEQALDDALGRNDDLLEQTELLRKHYREYVKRSRYNKIFVRDRSRRREIGDPE